MRDRYLDIHGADDSPFADAVRHVRGGGDLAAWSIDSLDEFGQCAAAALNVPVYSDSATLARFRDTVAAEYDRRIAAVESRETLTVKSSDIRAGDIVECHGMDCHVTGPILSAPSHHGPVYWTVAEVLNRADVSALAVPYSFTAEHGPDHLPTGRHTWQVQGNDLARWTVRRPL